MEKLSCFKICYLPSSTFEKMNKMSSFVFFEKHLSKKTVWIKIISSPDYETMYTRDELKLLKKEFWEGFGLFCGSHPVLRKRKSKFMLYNTKMKGVELKFDADREGAFVIQEVNHRNENERLVRYEQFERYKVLMEEFPEGTDMGFCIQVRNES